MSPPPPPPPPRRRTVLAAAAAVAALSLVACSGGGGGGGGGGGTAAACPLDALERAPGPVEVTFWHGMGGPDEAALEALVERFHASQAKVRVNLVFQGTYDDLRAKYLAAVRGGGAPDLVQLEDTNTQLAIDSDTTLPAQACVDAEGYDLSDFLPRVVDYYRVQGRLRSMPWNVSNPILYYNTKAFERAGLDPKRPPATLDELREFSRRIVDAGAARHGLALEVKSWYYEQWFAMADRPWLDRGNGREARAGAALFDDDLGRRLFGFVKDMVDSRLAVNVGRNPTERDALLAIAAGDAAMAFGTSAALGDVFSVLGTGQFPDVGLGVGPLPGLPGGEGGVTTGGASLWIVNRSAPEEQAAAWRFAAFLGEPAQQATWHAATGYLPIRRSAVDQPEVRDKWAERPEYRVAYDQLASGPVDAATAGAVTGAFPAVREAVHKGVERMLLQGAPPAAALGGAKREADAALADYNSRVGG